MSVRRFDRAGTLRGHFVRDDGTILAEGISVHEGIHEYRQADGSTRRELVTMDAVLASARSGARAPLTLHHPVSGFVTPKTVQQDGVGDVDGEVSVEEDAQGGFAKVKVAIRRQDAVDAFHDGVRELSWGYDVTLDETPGEWRGQRYDARQVDRKINHLALVPRGRGGPNVALRRDSADADYVGPVPPPAPPRRDTHSQELAMKRLPLLLAALGVEQHYDSDEAAIDAALPVAKRLKADAAALEAEKACRADADQSAEEMKADMEKMKEDMEAKQAEMDALQGKYDMVKKELDEMNEAEAERADAVQVERLTAIAKKLSIKTDGLDKAGLRRAIVCTRIDSIEGKSDAYIDAALDMIAAEADKGRADSRYDFGQDDGTRTDGDDKRADAFFDPTMARADEARATTIGGAA